MFSPLISDLRAALGRENVLSAAVGVGGLRLRRLDDRAAPARGGGLPALRATGCRGGEARRAARRGGGRPRRRHQPGRRLPAARTAQRCGHAHADEQGARDRPPQPHGGGRGGRAQSAAHPGPGRHRLPFRPRPLEPGRQHHRRQRGHQRRRPAHAQVRRDRQPRARPGGRAGRRLDRPTRASRSPVPTRSWTDAVEGWAVYRPVARRSWTSWACWSAAKARWASSPRSGSA